MTARVLSVSVDLDEIMLYRGLYGLPADEPGDLLFTRAVPRLAEWARQRGVPLTWFVVGRDLEHPDVAQAMSRLALGGDELGCHSHSHPYDLTRLSPLAMRREVEQAVGAIERLARVKVSGFRAPGYVVTDALLDLLRESGFSYDSSVFPCPFYYAVKAGALAWMAARGRPSHAILDAPNVLRAPTSPFRVGRPYWCRGDGLLEIPIQVTRRARLPFIGSALGLAGTFGARLLAQGVVGAPFVNLELHGIDALDSSDGLSALAGHQRDLRIPWQKKLDAIDAAVSLLVENGYAPVRMDELAAQARGPL